MNEKTIAAFFHELAHNIGVPKYLKNHPVASVMRTTGCNCKMSQVVGVAKVVNGAKMKPLQGTRRL